MDLFLQIESNAHFDLSSVVFGSDWCNPPCRCDDDRGGCDDDRGGCDDDPTSNAGVHRGIGAVVGAIGLLDCLSVSLPVPSVVGLLLLMGVVVTGVGLGSGADADACYG